MRNVFGWILLAGMGGAAWAQGPPPVLQIIREVNKEGREAAHEKIETEWAAAARTAKHPQRYVGFATISGASEYWFLDPMDSFATFEEWDKASSIEPYKSISANLNARDGEVRASSRTYWAVYRPDLSYNPEKATPARHKFIEVTTLRGRLGHEEEFNEAAKQYYAAWHKANIDAVVVGYEVVSGAPSETYLLLSMMSSMKEMDNGAANGKAIMEAMGDNFSQFMKSSGEALLSMDSTLLQVKPGMSYPPQQIIDADPAFWKPKAAATAAPKPAKKAAQ